MTSTPTVAVILCAGQGRRFGGKKQFFKLAGKPICIHTIEKFINSKLFDKIYLVIQKEDFDRVKELLEKYIYSEEKSKLIRICYGGENRQESSRNAVFCILQDRYPLNTIVLIHDGVRPFIDKRILIDNINNVSINQATDTVVDAIDTIVQVDDKGYIKSIPQRKYLKYGQTPQGFLLEHLAVMYTKIKASELKKYTDDCGIFLRVFGQSKRIKTIKGDYLNIKITTPLDMYLADKIFLLKNETFSVKLSQLLKMKNDLKKLLENKVIVIFGSTSGIGRALHEISLELGMRVHGTSRKLGVDVRDPVSVRNFLKRVYSIEGKVDYVVNTAGVLYRSNLESMSYEIIQDQIMINYFGSIVVAKESLLLRRETGVGPEHVILFSSSSYTRGRGSYSVYSSSKAAIVNFVQALCEEQDVVNFNVIVPERTATPMRSRWFGKEDPATLLKPETVAWYTLYLLGKKVCGLAFEVRKELEDIKFLKN